LWPIRTESAPVEKSAVEKSAIDLLSEEREEMSGG